MSATFKDERINLKLKHNAKQMLEHAEQTIHEYEVMILSTQDSETLCINRKTG